MVASSTKQRRGFAVMDPERRSAIAAKGGREAHRAGTAHEWSSNEAREAGRKGGAATAARTLAKRRERVAS